MYSKNVPEWNVHQEIFSHIQVIENARQYLLLRTVCFTEIVAGCPCKIHDDIFFLSI